MENTITYRIIDKRILGTYTIKEGMATRGGVQERIHYRPGALSIFDSENVNSTIRPAWVTFKNNGNPNDPACEIIVSKSNRTLIQFLETHPFFNVKYKRFSVEEEFAKSANRFKRVEDALELVNDPDKAKIRAMAMAILSSEYISATHNKCVADLKSMAIDHPEKVIEAFKDERYESKFYTALAFSQKVIETNPTGTAIIWGEGGGKIINVVPGEDPLDKFTNFILEGSRASVSVMQELGKRLKELVPDNIVVVSEAEKELEAAKARIAELEGENEVLSKMKDKVEFDLETVRRNRSLISKEEIDKMHPKDKIEFLTKEYKIVFGQNPPVNKKNDAEWMLSKLFENS